MKVSKSRTCLQAKKPCATPFPIGGKRHHTNQLQNYMANHVIWLLRTRGEVVGGTVTVIETVTEIVSFEKLRDL